MGHVAQLIDSPTHATRHHLLFGGHVEQRVLNLQTAATGNHTANQDILGAKSLPIAIDEFTGLSRQADHVLLRDRLENPRIAQILANNVGHILWQHATALPTKRHHGNRCRTITTATDHQGVSRLNIADQHGQPHQDNTHQGIH